MDSGDQHTQMSRGYNYIIYIRTVRDWASMDNGDSTHSRKEDIYGRTVRDWVAMGCGNQLTQKSRGQTRTEGQCGAGFQWTAVISTHRTAEDKEEQKDSARLGFNGRRQSAHTAEQRTEKDRRTVWDWASMDSGDRKCRCRRPKFI